MATSRIVWGIGTPRTLRPQWALHELGLRYNHKKFLPRSKDMDHPDFVALNKRHKVPFYQDDRVQLGESAAILLYLADRHGADVLTMPVPGTEEPAILLDHTMFIMTEIDARLSTIRLLESARWFTDRRQFVMGEHFGIADILLVSCLDWALLYGMDLPPSLGAYRDRVASRPGYLAAMAHNDPTNTE
jgi:glutathione S-transferase